MIPYRHMIPGFVVGLRSKQHPVRITGMLRGIQAVRMNPIDIVVSCNIKFIHKSIHICADKEVARCRHRTGRILLSGDRFQFAGNLDPFDPLVRDLIAQHIKNDTGVIPIPTDHPPQVRLPPLVEIKVIRIGHLPVGTLGVSPLLPTVPLIKNLIRHIQSQTVTQIIESRHKRIVTYPYSITPHRFQRLESFAPNAERNGRTETSDILMQTHTLYLNLFSVHFHTPFR